MPVDYVVEMLQQMAEAGGPTEAYGSRQAMYLASRQLTGAFNQ